MLPLGVATLSGAAFVAVSSRGLPYLVAAHFNAAGQVNGYMPRDFYVGLMIVLMVTVPVMVALVPMRAFNDPQARINLPHREYWLAHERRDETIAVLSRFARRFSVMLELFLCYGHWAVVQANHRSPPTLPSTPFIVVVVLFIVATMTGVIALIARFQRVPGGPN